MSIDSQTTGQKVRADLLRRMGPAKPEGPNLFGEAEQVAYIRVVGEGEVDPAAPQETDMRVTRSALRVKVEHWTESFGKGEWNLCFSTPMPDAPPFIPRSFALGGPEPADVDATASRDALAA